jgi:hypothetical protein
MRKMWENVGKCGKMWINVDKCGKMWENLEKFGKMWKNMEKYEKNVENVLFFYKESYLNVEVNRTDPFPSVWFPWSVHPCKD